VAPSPWPAGCFAASCAAAAGAPSPRLPQRNQRGLSESHPRELRDSGLRPRSLDGPLLGHLTPGGRLSPELLEAAGLVVLTKGGERRLRTASASGDVRFTTLQGPGDRLSAGRSLDGGEPKYLNSPETEVFRRKGQSTLRPWIAPPPPSARTTGVVVEGYFRCDRRSRRRPQPMRVASGSQRP